MRDTAGPSREWYTVKEAAPVLQVSADTIRRWIAAGRLDAEQPGGPGTQVRISQKAVAKAKARPYGGMAA